MWQTIIIWLIIAFCSAYLGRKYYRQWRAALSSETDGSCIESGCGCCSSLSSCSSARKTHPVQKVSSLKNQ